MRKIYYFVCGKYKKFKNLRISYILKNIIYSQKMLVLSIFCSNCSSKDENIF